MTKLECKSPGVDINEARKENLLLTSVLDEMIITRHFTKVTRIKGGGDYFNQNV